MQANSWADPSGHRENVTLVAQIYFPSGKRGLDGSDISVLNRLATTYTHLLTDNRVELSFVGHTDRVGSRRSNMKLGLGRACAVEAHMNRQLRQFSNYSSWQCLSLGEKQAAQHKPDAVTKSLDRRVDVYSTLILKQSVTMPPVRLEVPMRNRIVYRQFSKFSAGNLGRPPKPGDQAYKDVKKLVEDLITGGRTKVRFGSEDKKARQTRMFPASHQVNEVSIHEKNFYYTEGFAEIEGMDVEVRYTWGPPKNQVTIKHRVIGEIYHRVTSDWQNTKRITRQEGNKNPLVFPPDP